MPVKNRNAILYDPLGLRETMALTIHVRRRGHGVAFATERGQQQVALARAIFPRSPASSCASERRLDQDVEFIHENFQIPVTAPWLPYWLSTIILFRFASAEGEIRDSEATLAVQAVGSFALLIPPGDVRSVAGPSGGAFRLLPEASRRGY
jgi:hypothetical protein